MKKTEFFDVLVSFFPRRWLNTEKAGTINFFMGLSNMFSVFQQYIDLFYNNMYISAADELMDMYESEYGIYTSGTTGERREALLRHTGYCNLPLTAQRLKSAYALFGYEIEIMPSDSPYKMVIKILRPSGIPPDLSYVTNQIYPLIRCHIEIEYKYSPLTWVEVNMLKWSDFSGKAWDALEYA